MGDTVNPPNTVMNELNLEFNKIPEVTSPSGSSFLSFALMRLMSVHCVRNVQLEAGKVSNCTITADIV
jgi:hypothetical protein